MYRRIQLVVSSVAWEFLFFYLMVIVIIAIASVCLRSCRLSLSLCLPARLTQHQNEH